MISKAEQKLTYPIALLLSTSRRKTFEALGRDIGISGDTIIRRVNKSATTVDELVLYAKKLFKKKAYLLIDDTLILKIYSRYIEGACDNYSSSDGRSYRSLCSVVAMITDGNTALPIDQVIWTSAEFSQTTYKKKWELAQVLIKKIQGLINIKAVVMDGLYDTHAMIQWLISNNVPFEMRFHSNRVIEYKGMRSQIRESEPLQLSGKRPKRKIRASWYKINLYFTALRRRIRNGEFITIYQVSNYKASAREHVQIYGYRWNIEKFFRTAKQKLGLNDCQSLKQETQEKHIMNVFLTYILVQFERKKNKLKNPEAAIKSLKQRNFHELKSYFLRSGQIFGIA